MSQPERLLIDTNVVSSIFEGHPLAGAYEQRLAGKSNAISFQTLAELLLWAEKGGWSRRRRDELETFLKSFVFIHSDPLICAR